MSNVEAIKKALEVAETLREYTDIDANEGANRDVVAASYAACDAIAELSTTLGALRQENAELKQHVEELQEKIDPEKDCACSYDEAGAVCDAHSPMLKAAEAEVKRLQAEIDRKSSMPGDHRYWEGQYRDEAAENERLREALEALLAAHNIKTVRGELLDNVIASATARARTALASVGEEHHAE